MRNSLLTLLAAGLPLMAQLGGPTSGYVYEPQTRELRPMRGMAGLAHLGDALVQDADSASVSADGTLAVVARAGNVELIRGFDSAAPSRLALAQENGSVIFAWSGQDLAAVFTGSRRAIIWRNVAKSVDDATAVNATSIDGDITAVALDGANLLLAAKGGVYLNRNGEMSRIQTVADPAAIARAGKDLYIADRASGQVLLLRDFAGDAVAAETFAAVGEPVGLQLAGRRLLVASAQTRTVDVFDLASRAREGSLELDFSPTRLQALGSGQLALLNQGSADEPLYVLDAKDALRVYFVPAGRNQ